MIKIKKRKKERKHLSEFTRLSCCIFQGLGRYSGEGKGGDRKEFLIFVAFFVSLLNYIFHQILSSQVNLQHKRNPQKVALALFFPLNLKP